MLSTFHTVFWNWCYSFSALCVVAELVRWMSADITPSTNSLLQLDFLRHIFLCNKWNKWRSIKRANSVAICSGPCLCLLWSHIPHLFGYANHLQEFQQAFSIKFSIPTDFTSYKYASMPMDVGHGPWLWAIVYSWYGWKRDRGDSRFWKMNKWIYPA